MGQVVGLVVGIASSIGRTEAGDAAHDFGNFVFGDADEIGVAADGSVIGIEGVGLVDVKKESSIGAGSISAVDSEGFVLSGGACPGAFGAGRIGGGPVVCDIGGLVRGGLVCDQGIAHGGVTDGVGSGAAAVSKAGGFGADGDVDGDGIGIHLLVLQGGVVKGGLEF
jgi:hypothetical protein